MTIPLTNLLSWIVPPIAGAAIGYITNAIAIKMLFRPLTEKRVLGIKVPFTPGIIPRQRGNLATSIANMVSQQLLTEDAIKRQIKSDSFRRNLKEHISYFTETFLKRRIDSFLTPDGKTSGTAFSEENEVSSIVQPENSTQFDLYKPERSTFEEGELRGLLRTFGSSVVNSEGFRDLAETMIRWAVDYLFGFTVKDFFIKYEGARKLVEGIASLLTSEATKNQVLKWTDSFISERLYASSKTGSILPAQMEEHIATAFHYLYPSLFEALLNWLKKEETRRELEKRGIVFVQDIIDNLRPVQKFFISAAKYDITLEQRMPDIVSDLIKRIDEIGHDPNVRENLTNTIKQGILGLKEKTFSELGEHAEQKIGNAIHLIVTYLLENLATPKNIDRLTAFIFVNIEKRGNKTIEEICSTYLKLDKESAVSYLSSRLTGWLYAEGGTVMKGISAVMLSFLHQRREVEIGQLLGIGVDVKERLDLFLVYRAQSMLENRVPQIVNSFDIHTIVIEKINSLDMENVEKLLLMVIEKHLKWINIFGAILGSLIGSLQVVLNKFL